MRPSQKPPGLRTAFAIVAVALLAACGSSSGNTITPLKTTSTTAGGTTTTTTVDPPTTTTLASTGDAAIIAADQAGAQAFISAGLSNPVQPGYPALAAHVSGKQLANDQTLLTELGLHRHHFIGTYTQTNPIVAQHVGNQALVLSCATDNTAVVDNTTGGIVTPSPHSHKLVNDLLQLVNGTWMLINSGVRNPTC